jgi:hypothetical protein
MITSLSKLLIAAALSSLAVIACDRPRVVTIASEQSAGFAEHGNTRCVLVDDQVFCSSARMRAPIELASFVAI